MPTDAYWANGGAAEIAAFAGLLTAVGVLAAPFIQGWWSNKSKSHETDANRIETAQQRLERIANEQFKRVEAERDNCLKKCSTLQNEYDTVDIAARAMEDWAHYFRHEAVNMIQRYHSLFNMFEMLAQGDMAKERVSVVLEQLRLRLPTDPRPVPLLRHAAEEKPP